MPAELVLLVGDLVELTSALPHRRSPRVGSRGQVLVVGLPWGCVTVAFDGDSVRCWQVHPRHLCLVARPEPVAALAADGSEG